MELRSGLLSRLDLSAAVREAAPAKGEFFPARLESEAALVDPEGYAEWLSAQLLVGFTAYPPETIWVPRRGHGSRPVPDLSFRERVVLAALTRSLSEHLWDDRERLGLRSLAEPEEGARRAFERQPLEDAAAAYVVLADVASFYEYVDHDRLLQDVVELTGDVDLRDALAEALGEIMTRQFGLPQGPRSSDVLADVFLSAIDRRLRRSGIETWRFNDDFLMSAADPLDAQLKLIELERALRGRGLSLNNAKNRVPDRETYEGWVVALADRLSEAVVAEADTGFYDFDPVAFEEVELGELPVETVEELFAQVLDDEKPDPYDVNGRLLQQALPLLAAGESPVVLNRLEDLLQGWSSHTRTLSLYLRALIGTEHEEHMVQTVASTLGATSDLVPWVRGWLLDPLARSDDPIGSAAFDQTLRGWLQSDREPWFVRGRCALVMASRSQILDREQIGAIFARAPAPTRADLVAAVALAQPDWGYEWLHTLDGTEPLLRRIPDLLQVGDPAPML